MKVKNGKATTVGVLHGVSLFVRFMCSIYIFFFFFLYNNKKYIFGYKTTHVYNVSDAYAFYDHSLKFINKHQRRLLIENLHSLYAIIFDMT
jgi:hypothetical protein